jgi:hypothetical protein
MVVVSLPYKFRASFNAPAADAYAWATDFGPADAALFGDGRSRAVRRVGPDALVLTDITHPNGRRRRIDRLVRMDPDALSWTNTHLSGPFLHSQFWYHIAADSARKSHLEFRGLKLETHARAISASARARAAEENRREDADLWRRRLAPVLERDVARARRRT